MAKCSFNSKMIVFVNVRINRQTNTRSFLFRKLFRSDKKCDLSYANIQGKQALIKKFQNSQVLSEDIAYQPKLFYSSGSRAGQEQPWPYSNNSSSSSNGNTNSHSKDDIVKSNISVNPNTI